MQEVEEQRKAEDDADSWGSKGKLPEEFVKDVNSPRAKNMKTKEIIFKDVLLLKIKS